MKVCIFLVALLAIAKCIYAGDDAILTPISTAALQSDPKRADLIQPRIKRQVPELVGQLVPPVLQTVEKTLKLVPEIGGNGNKGAENSQNGKKDSQ